MSPTSQTNFNEVSTNRLDRHDVAIVGMACRFPGAPNLQTFWRNIVEKRSAITDPPEQAWEAEIFYDPDSDANDRVYCKKGGYLGDLATFEPLTHGVMPKTVDGSEPDQWLALETAAEALADAGYGEDREVGQRTAVIIGKGTYLNHGNFNVVQHGTVVDQTLKILASLHPDYSEAELAQIRKALKADLPAFNADTVPGLIPNIIAGRIANKLDLMGPSYTVDGACASSLIALDNAVRELASGRCDMALVGGSHVVTPVPVMMVFCHLDALSRRQEIRPFDRSADGTILGEGVGMIVVKRLSDALRDGDRIYSVVRGVGVASDGRGLSVMAPRVEGELLALQRAYEQADMEPTTVGLIEAHGTGTPVGDRTEIESLTQLFGPREGTLPQTALGSVKSMIGHLMPAAGIAGIIKASLALHHRVLPPTLNVDRPVEALTSSDTPFYLNAEPRPWVHGEADHPRRAGVNSFGFGGINAHVVLEEAPVTSPRPARFGQRDSELILVGAEQRSGLIDRLTEIGGYIERANRVDLADLAYTLRGERTKPQKLAIIASDIDDLKVKMERAREKLSNDRFKQIKDVQGIYYFSEPLANDGGLAFLYPGEGSQYEGMLADLYTIFPTVQRYFDQVDRIFAHHQRGYRPSDLTFPRSSLGSEASEGADIWQMESAVEVVLTANRALAALLEEFGIQADARVGHSTGEYSALMAAGVIDVERDEALRNFSLELNQTYRQADDDEIGSVALIAVAAPAEKLGPHIEALTEEIYLAMDNCPHQSVLICSDADADRVCATLADAGFIYERLAFDRPYHTPLFERYSRRLRPFLERWLTRLPKEVLYSCTSCEPFPGDLEALQELALRHWVAPVRFRDTIEKMYADGIRLFVEVGTGGNLTSFVGDILRGRPHLSLAANLKSRSGITQLHHLLGALVAQGITVNLDPLFAQRDVSELDLARKLFEPAPLKLALKTGWPRIDVPTELAEQLRQSRVTEEAPVIESNGSMPSSISENFESFVERKTKEEETMTSTPVSPTANGSSRAVEYTNGRAEQTNGNLAAYPEPLTAGPNASPVYHDTGLTQVMMMHLQMMERFLETQQVVMQAYLTGEAAPLVERGKTTPSLPAPRPSAPMPAPMPQAYAAPAPPPPVRAEPTPVAPPPAPAAPVQPQEPQPVHPPAAPQSTLDAGEIEKILLNLVSDRTGYPIEMLDLSLDLEASLGIDSIKRVEILGSFQQETGIAISDDMDSLSSRKTLREIIDFLAERVAA